MIYDCIFVFSGLQVSLSVFSLFQMDFTTPTPDGGGSGDDGNIVVDGEDLNKSILVYEPFWAQMHVPCISCYMNEPKTPYSTTYI